MIIESYLLDLPGAAKSESRGSHIQLGQIPLSELFEQDWKSIGQLHFASFDKRVPNYGDMATFSSFLWRKRFSLKKA